MKRPSSGCVEIHDANASRHRLVIDGIAPFQNRPVLVEHDAALARAAGRRRQSKEVGMVARASYDGKEWNELGLPLHHLGHMDASGSQNPIEPTTTPFRMATRPAAGENDPGGYHELLDELESGFVERFGTGRDVLEVGCGTGLVLRRIQRVRADGAGRRL